MRCRNYRTLPL